MSRTARCNAGKHGRRDGWDRAQVPPASNSSTLTSGFSASRRATTEPEEPEPQTMKSYCDFNSAASFRWLMRTRSVKAASTPSKLVSARISFGTALGALQLALVPKS